MSFPTVVSLSRRALATLALIPLAWVSSGFAGDFSVTPIRAELKPGAMSETITIANDAKTRLRVGIRLLEWSQDADGNDVFKETGDIVYFPRQMDIEPESKRLVRIGAKTPGALTERTYRLFIEEEPDPLLGNAGNAQVAFLLRFGVPIFVSPVNGKSQPQMSDPVLEKGKLSLVMKNEGNQHYRVHRIALSDGAGFTQDISGWYSLAGSQRTYSATLPLEVCRKLRVLNIAVEGEGVRIERQFNVDPARCA